MAFFLTHNCWHILTGLVRRDQSREGDILEAFWRKYRILHPSHPVFQHSQEGRIHLRRTVPLVLHGDEGRGRRRDAFMIISFRSLLGRGLHPEAKAGKRRGIRKKWLKLKTNFRGHSFTTRYMFSALRKGDYTGENDGVFQNVLSAAAEEASFMSDIGLLDAQGHRYNAILLNIIGDWPFLHKSGRFARSYNNVQKRKQVRQPPGGICHQCMAGVHPVSWEQISTRRPAWKGTICQSSPFLEESPFRRVLHVPDRLELMWAWDWFHCYHLGVSKNFLGSALALLSEKEEGGTVDERFSNLSLKFQTWCITAKKRRGSTKISKELLGWQTTTVYPTGIWHKGALSTILMSFVESICERSDFSSDPFLQLVKEATMAIQACVRGLYTEQLWLKPASAGLIANEGMRFLRRYSELALEAQRAGRLLFIIQPKHHALHHMLITLWDDSQRGIESLNPLATSVQQDEDFIGRGSRLSRRVTSMKPALERTMQRYLTAAFHEFTSAGFLVRPL